MSLSASQVTAPLAAIDALGPHMPVIRACSVPGSAPTVTVLPARVTETPAPPVTVVTTSAGAIVPSRSALLATSDRIAYGTACGGSRGVRTSPPTLISRNSALLPRIASSRVVSAPRSA